MKLTRPTLFCFRKHYPLLGIRWGGYRLKLKPRDNLLFSERHRVNSWVLPLGKWAVVYQWPSKRKKETSMSKPTGHSTVVWNTGRRYTKFGQRIAARFHQDENANWAGVIFYDIDRGIWGAFTTPTQPIDITSFVMARYDRGEDHHDYHLPGDLQQELADVAALAIPRADAKVAPEKENEEPGWL